MLRSKMSYWVAVLCIVFAALLLAWFMIFNPENKNLYVYGAGIFLFGALMALLVGLKFRMEERKTEEDNALWKKRNNNQ